MGYTVLHTQFFGKHQARILYQVSNRSTVAWYMSNEAIRPRPRHKFWRRGRGRGQKVEPRPRPNCCPRYQSGLETLTYLTSLHVRRLQNDVIRYKNIPA